jgi:tetratricopeptide (TPR) repeat protein
MADVALFGMDAAGHHAVGLCLHALNTLLLFLFLFRLTDARWRSALVAALFSLHPLHVASVAWASERKELLASCLLLLACLAWLRHLRRPGPALNLAALGLFACALLAKSMPISFPFVLVLLDWWPLGRWRPEGGSSPAGFFPPAPLWIEKLPLFLLSAAAGIAVFVAHRTVGAMTPMAVLPLGSRLAYAALAYVRYLGKVIRPIDLSYFYPHPVDFPPWPALIPAVAALALLLAAAWRWRLSRPFLGVGLLWFFGTLIPVIGIVQVGAQSMADHYTYLPLIGIFIAISWGLAALVAAAPNLRWTIVATVLGALASLTIVTSAQVRDWRNDDALYRHALRVNPDNWLAHLNLGASLARRGRVREAVVHFRTSLSLEPKSAETLRNLGLALAQLGDPAAAIPFYFSALQLHPGDPELHVLAGQALASAGRPAEAAAAYQWALRLRPDHEVARRALARLLAGSAPPAPGKEP